MNRGGLVDVFPIDSAAFGLKDNWFETYVPRLIEPAYLLLTLLLIVSVGVAVLKRFDDAELEKKIWNIPVIIVLIGTWPTFVWGLKTLVDTFNTFLAIEVFGLSWQGFGFRAPDSIVEVIGWPLDGLVRLLPLLSYWIIYSFYLIFFFFYAVLGPFILAKGVLEDEIETFLEVLKEITILFLWQTMVVVLVGFVMPDIVRGSSFPVPPPANYFFLSLLLGILLLFVPSMTRKFASQFSGPFFPPGTRLATAFLTIGMIRKTGQIVGSAAPPSNRGESLRHLAMRSETFMSRLHDRRHATAVDREKQEIEREFKLRLKQEEEEDVQREEEFLELTRRAKKEFEA